MKTRMLLLAVTSFAFASTAIAEDVRLENENGKTYRVTRQRVQVPVTETRIQEHTQTVYRDQYVTETRPSVRTTYTPVTEYQLEARWHGVLNPFAPAYIGYHYVPRTRWERRDQPVSHTVTRRQLVPETRTVQVPVRTHRMVEEERITRREVPAGGNRRASVVRGNGYGGIAKVSDPPGKTVWTASDTRVIR